MVKHIADQLAAHGASVTPKHTSGRGTAGRPAESKKSTKKEPSEKLTPEQKAANDRKATANDPKQRYGYYASRDSNSWNAVRFAGLSDQALARLIRFYQHLTTLPTTPQ